MIALSLPSPFFGAFCVPVIRHESTVRCALGRIPRASAFERFLDRRRSTQALHRANKADLSSIATSVASFEILDRSAWIAIVSARLYGSWQIGHVSVPGSSM